MRMLFFPLPSRRTRRLIFTSGLLLALGVVIFHSSLAVRGLLPAVGSGDNPLFQVNTSQQLAALAVNVAWGEEALPAMLEALEQDDTAVTFFVVGEWAERFPELTRSLAAQGHEIGNHSWSHPYPSQIEAEALKKEISATGQLLSGLTGCDCRLFAPPFGDWNDKIVLAAADVGYRTVLWTTDTADWQSPGPDIIVSRVLDNLVPGSIMLMHPTEQTAEALPEILSGVKESGFRLVPVGQLIAAAKRQN